MRKYISVLMLGARSSLFKMLLIFLGMAVGETALFLRVLYRDAGFPSALEELIASSGIYWVYSIAFLLLCGALALTGCDVGCRTRYTLQRLAIQERTIALLWAGYNACCFFLFWVFQLVLLLAFSQLYIQQLPPEHYHGQIIYLAAYRSEFFHGILPMDDFGKWVANFLQILALGIVSAGFAYKQRRGKKPVGLAIYAIMLLLTFRKEAGDAQAAGLLMAGVGAIVAFEALARMIWPQPEEEGVQTE